MDIKKLSIDYGYFMAIIVVLFTLLLGVVVVSRKSWENGLKTQVMNTFEQVYPGTYTVGDMIPVQHSLSTSAAVYELEPTAASLSVSEETGYGIIIRTATLFGTLPVVFRYSVTSGTEFIGIAGFSRQIQKESAIIQTLEHSFQINRWKHRIPLLVQDSISGGNH